MFSFQKRIKCGGGGASRSSAPTINAKRKTKEKKNAPQKKELALDFIASEESNGPIYFYPL
jgi:hypothetical protein